MKAMRFHEYGGPDVLRYEDVDRPVPASLSRLLLWTRGRSAVALLRPMPILVARAGWAG